MLDYADGYVECGLCSTALLTLPRIPPASLLHPFPARLLGRSHHYVQPIRVPGRKHSTCPLHRGRLRRSSGHPPCAAKLRLDGSIRQETSLSCALVNKCLVVSS